MTAAPRPSAGELGLWVIDALEVALAAVDRKSDQTAHDVASILYGLDANELRRACSWAIRLLAQELGRRRTPSQVAAIVERMRLEQMAGHVAPKASD